MHIGMKMNLHKLFHTSIFKPLGTKISTFRRKDTFPDAITLRQNVLGCHLKIHIVSGHQIRPSVYDVTDVVSGGDPISV